MIFDSARAYEVLYPHFQKRIHRDEPLHHHSSFGVGGPADIWITIANRKELIDLVSFCAEEHWPLLLIGDGTNIIFADAGVRGIVARISTHEYNIEEQADNTALIVTEAGVRWAQLLRDLVPLGWGGLEFGVGIPGTLGAGVVSNVGAHEQNLGQVLEWIEVLDARGSNSEAEDEVSYPLVRRYMSNELDLGYRHSRFRAHRLTYIDKSGKLVLPMRKLIEPPEIVLTLGLRLHRQDPKILAALLDKNKKYRKHTEPSLRHAGSIFKDPPEELAARLIKQVGLEGKMHGNAQVSELNPNYIINKGNASATDIALLIEEMHNRVLEELGIDLALNVELLGEWSFSRNPASPSAASHA